MACISSKTCFYMVIVWILLKKTKANKWKREKKNISISPTCTNSSEVSLWQKVLLSKIFDMCSKKKKARYSTKRTRYYLCLNSNYVFSSVFVKLTHQVFASYFGTSLSACGSHSRPSYGLFLAMHPSLWSLFMSTESRTITMSIFVYWEMASIMPDEYSIGVLCSPLYDQGKLMEPASTRSESNPGATDLLSIALQPFY